MVGYLFIFGCKIDCQKPALGNTLELKVAHSDLEIESAYNEKAAYDKGNVLQELFHEEASVGEDSDSEPSSQVPEDSLPSARVHVTGDR